jgi:hypothetical protein
MIKITDKNDIAAALEKFEADGNGADATCRVLPGQWEQENCQEWAERGTLFGKPAKIYYLFEVDEIEDEDSGRWPWDAAHITKIDVAEEDESI